MIGRVSFSVNDRFSLIGSGWVTAIVVEFDLDTIKMLMNIFVGIHSISPVIYQRALDRTLIAVEPSVSTVSLLKSTPL